eukprot:jgi/Psemu1/321723/estExt_fgenesh1_pg.C_80024
MDIDTKPSAKEPQPRRQLQTLMVTTILIVALFVFFSVVSESETFSSKTDRAQVRKPVGNKANTKVSEKVSEKANKKDKEKVSEKANKKDKEKANKKAKEKDKEKANKKAKEKAKEKANGICSNLCEKRRQKRVEVFQGDLLDSKDLLKLATAEKERLLEKLHMDYGKFFEHIFVDNANGGYRPCSGVTEDGLSFERLKRKLKIKILSMQSGINQQDSDISGCDCSDANGKALRSGIEETEDPSSLFNGIDKSSLFEKYVWASGGHSAAAGHGNLYNESYTAYMERDVKDVFASIGIEFEGRNYAMGGTASATDVSMCWQQIFGQDVDFFSWDYGMVDGNDPVKLFHFSYRGGISESRPAAMLMHYGGRSAKSRLGVFQTLEEMGMAAFYSNEESMASMRDQFPDSAAYSSDEELSELPEYVRNYKCGTSIEKGDPYCTRDKFTKWGCENRMKQTSWHPGFKEHALSGHGLALFMTDALLSALQDLVEHNNGDTAQLLSQLQEEDIELHTNFINAELPDSHHNLLGALGELTLSESESNIDASLFFKGKSICHTGRLPSQTRYKGILTNSDQVGQPAPVGEETYYLGFNKVAASRTASENQEIRLVYDMSKEREDKCVGVIVKPDYPDSFFINSLDGWTKLTFPNEAEKKAYRYDPAEFEGIIIIHGKVCDWGKCPNGFLLPEEDHLKKNWEMKINGKSVTTVKNVGNNAVIVGGENGFRFAPNSNEQYDIEIRVNKENHYFQLVDFVLY